jgi:hypothetical protein
MTKTFYNNPVAEISADRISLNAFIEDIVLRGLRTLKARNEVIFEPALPVKYGIYAVTIRAKSRMFHRSHK